MVDDYEPFRSVVVSQLQEKPELVFIAEASDGFEAVQKVSPKSKILFVSECRAADIAEAALNTSGGGYVVKSDCTRDLSAAVDAVLKGERFLSASLTGDHIVPSHTETLESEHKTDDIFFAESAWISESPKIVDPRFRR